MTSRDQFEEWISRPPFECSVARWPDDPDKTAWPGNYRKLDVQLAWCAWQDSRMYALTEAVASVDEAAVIPQGLSYDQRIAIKGVALRLLALKDKEEA